MRCGSVSRLLASLACVLVACGGGAAEGGAGGCVDDGAACEAMSVATCHEAACDPVSGQCFARPMPNGTPCTEGAVCYAGACLATCETSRDCADGRLCSARRLAAGSTLGLCLAPSDVTCATDLSCLEVLTGPCEVATCDPAAGRCRLGGAQDGGACGEGGACYHGVCYPQCGVGRGDCPTGQACLEALTGLGLCVPAGAVPCDGDAACATLVTGLCGVPACVDGVCAALPASNGSACADGRVCWAGACVGSGPCPPDHPCGTGATCVAGDAGDACVAFEALTCAGPADCERLVEPGCLVASCEAASLRCRFSPEGDGTSCRADSVCLGGACRAACDGSEACAPGELCVPIAGTAGGACAEVPCAAAGDCAALLVETGPCEAVTCNTLTNRCQRSPLPEGATCDDGDLCNGLQRCRDGACVLAAKAVSCVTPPGQSCTRLECEPTTGACVAVSAEEGLACEDGNPCTSDTTCQGGLCLGQVTCTTCLYDQDCTASDDGDRCNGWPLCLGGVCVWSPATLVACPAPAEPCLAAACEPSSGACLEVPLDDASPCLVSDDLCAARYACQAGACVEVAPPVSCPPSADACERVACDAASGACVALPLPEAVVLEEAFDGAEAPLLLHCDAPGASAEVTTGAALSPPGALWLQVAGGDGTPRVYTSPELMLPIGVPLVASAVCRARLDVAAGDVLRLELGSADDGWHPVFVLDAAHPPAGDGWLPVAAEVPALTGPAWLRAQVVAAAPAGVEAWLDDLRLVRPCP